MCFAHKAFRSSHFSICVRYTSIFNPPVWRGAAVISKQTRTCMVRGTFIGFEASGESRPVKPLKRSIRQFVQTHSLPAGSLQFSTSQQRRDRLLDSATKSVDEEWKESLDTKLTQDMDFWLTECEPASLLLMSQSMHQAPMCLVSVSKRLLYNFNVRVPLLVILTSCIVAWPRVFSCWIVCISHCW